MTAPPPEPSIRTVRIEPPSIRGETSAVLRAAAMILIGTWLYLANASAPARGRVAAAPVTPPYQKLFADLPPQQQRMFRALHEGLIEAENVRSTSGAWPTPPTLADQGIPPFAADPITARERYTWTKRQDGNVINYIGIPATPAVPAFLLLVLEPAPGAPPDLTPSDELHHRLANGDVLHVSVWIHPEAQKLKDDLVVIPEAGGWTQLLAGPALPAKP